MSRQQLIGIALVVTGASCYGMLGTIVELAYQSGYSIYEVTVSQYIVGMGVLASVFFFRKKKSSAHRASPSKKQNAKLMLAGIPIGLTGICYYYSIKYVPVSISVVLIMQTVWMGIVAEAVLSRKIPSVQRIIAVLVTWMGTILATNAIDQLGQLNVTGVLWGLAGAGCYTLFMAVADRLAPERKSIERSFYMIAGATLVILVLAFPYILVNFNTSIFWKWGILLALFGPVVPPVLFNIGFPKTGIGLGSILSSFEIPVAVIVAYLVLGEQVLVIQWGGIVLILVAVILINSNWVDQDNGS